MNKKLIINEVISFTSQAIQALDEHYVAEEKKKKEINIDLPE